MKKVLIPLGFYLVENVDSIEYNVVRNSYLYKLSKYNIFPVMTAAASPQEVIDLAYEESDGVMLLGGFDINPKSYGEELHPETKQTPEYVDEFEINLIKRTIEDKKPLLAICRGAQMMNVALGGTMHQEIDDLNLDEKHNFSTVERFSPYYSLLDGGPRHDVFVDKDSKAYKVLGQEVANTNSGHHQTINKVGEGIRVSGKTKAGVVEIIEYGDDDHFCFGLQPHPEVDEDGSFEPFFAEFAKAL